MRQTWTDTLWKAKTKIEILKVIFFLISSVQERCENKARGVDSGGGVVVCLLKQEQQSQLKTGRQEPPPSLSVLFGFTHTEVALGFWSSSSCFPPRSFSLLPLLVLWSDLWRQRRGADGTEGRFFFIYWGGGGNTDVSPPAFVLFGLSVCICVLFIFYPSTRLRFVWTLVSRANPETSAARGDALVSKSDVWRMAWGWVGVGGRWGNQRGKRKKRKESQGSLSTPPVVQENPLFGADTLVWANIGMMTVFYKENISRMKH